MFLAKAETNWMIFQYGVSVIAGCLTFWWMMQDKLTDARAATFGGFLVGLVAARFVMFLITWGRFGWHSARSMKMH